MKAIINARVITPDRIIKDGLILIEGSRIKKVGAAKSEVIPDDADIIDANGLYAGPGFVDIHCHGGSDYWCHIEPGEMASHHLKHGTTSLVCTIYRNVSFEDTIQGIGRIKKACLEKKPGNIIGIHLEGPYLNPRFGAASTSDGKIPDLREYNSYIEHAEGLLRQWTFSPELPDLDEFIDTAVKHGIPLSMGHSAAGPEQVDRYVKKGASIVTHIMDATGFHISPSRYKGTREPSFDECCMIHDLYTEVIPDSEGIHVRPVMLKLIVKTMGYDRVVIVTDACTSLETSLVRQETGNLLSPPDLNIVNGALYGSRLTMDKACINMKKHTGCSMLEIFKMAAKNPAEAVKVIDEVGTLEAGKRANIILVDDDLNLHQVILDGIIQD